MLLAEHSNWYHVLNILYENSGHPVFSSRMLENFKAGQLCIFLIWLVLVTNNVKFKQNISAQKYAVGLLEVQTDKEKYASV